MAGGRKRNGAAPRRKRRASRSKSRQAPSKVQRRVAIPPPFRLLPNPITPAKDSSHYRQLVLANGLKVLLISTTEGDSWDPSWTLKFPSFLTNSTGEELNCSKLPSYLPNYPSLECGGGGSDECCSRTLGKGRRPKGSISITIGSGSFADPPEFQGLAHFVEHLVHHGTASFPGENSFSEFVEKCTGSTNAFTDKNVTNYHAVVDATRETLHELCSRYTSMLCEPLMTLASVTREIESVDNEYFMRKVGHAFRHNHLLHVATVDYEGHPMRKFSIGSKEGLMNPQVRNSNLLLKEASLRFIKTHYYAENMTLVLQAPQDIGFLQNCVLETFSEIPQRSQFPQEVESGWATLPYNVRQFNRLFTAKPSNSDANTLSLAWALPPKVWKDYKSHVLPYLESIFGHEAPGGLAHYLREKGLILSLVIPREGGIFKNDFVTFFQMSYYLTQLGRDRIDDVLEATFSYIKLHRRNGRQRSICNQIRAAEKIQLEKMEMEKSLQQFIRISIQMLHYDPVDVIVGDGTPHGTFSSTKISECLNQLTPARANYFMFTSDQNSSRYMLEEVYGTSYVVEDLPQVMLQRLTDVEIFREFRLLPLQNPFLEDDEDDVDREELIIHKEIIRETDKVLFECIPCVRMASKQAIFSLIAELGISRTEARVNRHVFDVMTVVLELEIFPRLFHQVDVGFHGNVQTLEGAFRFTGSGLTGRSITESFVAIIEGFENFPQNTNEETFKMAKEAVLHHYFAIAAYQLHSVRDLSMRLKHVDYLTVIEAHDLLLDMEFTDFVQFVQDVKEEISFHCQCSGLIRRRDALQLCMQLENFRCRPIPHAKLNDPEWNFELLKRIPIGEKCLRMRSLVPNDKVFLVANKYQLSPRNNESDVKTGIIYVLMRRKLVFQLRTTEQLGYMVHLEYFLDSDFSGITVYVLAHLDKHSPCFVDSRIEEFFKMFYQFEFTVDKVTAALDGTKIIRSVGALRHHYRRYLLSGQGSQKSKLSVQIVPSRDDGNCLCHHRQNEFPCKSSQWLPHFTQIGKDRTQVSFAGHRDVQDSGYFITSIDDYHRSA